MENFNVILLNCSPHKNGCTKRALIEISDTLKKEGVNSEIIDVDQNVTGCLACGACSKLKKCIKDDQVNIVAEKVRNSDGLIVGAPVYFASPNGTAISFLDRLFCSARANFEYKIGASIASARRAGTIASFDILNKYFLISNMIVPGSNYWNEVHGNTPNDVEQDLEGLQTMRVLAKNVAWLIKNLKGKDTPTSEPKIKTNFIKG